MSSIRFYFLLLALLAPNVFAGEPKNDPFEGVTSTCGRENSPLLKALLDRQSFEAIKRSGIELDHWRTNCDGATPLMVAIALGQVDSVNGFIGLGANVNARMEDGRRPLMLAVALGDLAIVQALTHAGARVNTMDDEDLTALHYLGLYNQNHDVLEHLLSLKANVNAKASEGLCSVSPLVALTMSMNPSREQVNIAETLVQNGATLDGETCTQSNLLHMAVFRNRHGLIRYYLSLERFDVNAMTKSKLTALHIALDQRSLKSVEILLSANANYKIPFPGGTKPIHCTWNVPIVRALLAAGASRSELTTFQRAGLGFEEVTENPWFQVVFYPMVALSAIMTLCMTCADVRALFAKQPNRATSEPQVIQVQSKYQPPPRPKGHPSEAQLDRIRQRQREAQNNEF
jgi:ankyrin repeat protein